MDKLNELLSGLQAGVTNIGPEAGAKVTAHFHKLIGDLNRPDLEPVRRELMTLQVLLEGRTPNGLNSVGIGQQMIALGRTVKSVSEPGAAQTLEYLAATLEQQGRGLVGDLEVAVAPDARFANAEAQVVGTASANETEPGNVYAGVRGI